MHHYLVIRERVYIDTLKEAIRLTDAGWIVIGWPLNPNDLPLPYHQSGIIYSSPSLIPITNTICRNIQHFISNLRASNVYLPIILWDERSSSRYARQRLANIPSNSSYSSTPRSKLPSEYEKYIDAEAAYVILDNFIQTIHESGLLVSSSLPSIPDNKKLILFQREYNHF